MSKTRKILTTLTMVAVATTASLTAVSSAQAHVSPWPHSHTIPGPIYSGPLIPGVGPVYTGPLFPGSPTPTPTPTPPPAHDHSSHNHGLNSGQAAALGLFGGVLIGSLAARRQQAPAAPAAGLPAQHYIYCDNKYRSYVAATDSYTGYDGYQHRCNSPYIY